MSDWVDDDRITWLTRLVESYRMALMNADPQMCERLDAKVDEYETARLRPIKDPDRMVATKQAAFELGVSVDTVNGWARAEAAIRREKRGNRAFFHLGDLDEYRRGKKNRHKSAMS